MLGRRRRNIILVSSRRKWASLTLDGRGRRTRTSILGNRKKRRRRTHFIFGGGRRGSDKLYCTVYVHYKYFLCK